MEEETTMEEEMTMNEKLLVSPPDDIYPSPQDPMAVAREIVSDLRRDNKDSIHRWHGYWIGWQGSQWTEIEELQVKALVYKALERAVYRAGKDLKPWQPNRNKVANVAEAMMAVTHLPMSVSPPVWLSTPDVPIRDIVSCSNGLLHVTTRNLESHTPDFFTLVSVPFAYGEDAPEPVRWLSFLNDIWPDDPEAIGTLQEWFGYIMSGRTDLQKILMMVGPPRSGKGTIARILRALIGTLNVAGPTLSSFETNFGLQPLLGKSLAIVSDARLKPGSDKKVIERLLSVSGEDSITIDRKYKEPFTGPIPVRFVIISNEIPKFGDSSGAIANRFIILQLVKDWLGKEDTKLTARIMEELPGIMLWALEGLDRVVRNGYIQEPKSSSWARNILKEVSSPVKAFISERFIKDPKREIETTLAYEEWTDWCHENGIDYVTDKFNFGKDLHAAMPGLRQVSRRDAKGRTRYYRGITLRPEVASKENDGPRTRTARTETGSTR